MSFGDIYVQVTASSESSGKSRSVVVFVPQANIEEFRRQKKDSKSDRPLHRQGPGRAAD